MKHMLSALALAAALSASLLAAGSASAADMRGQTGSAIGKIGSDGTVRNATGIASSPAYEAGDST